MSQAYFLAQTGTGLHLLQFPGLKQHNSYALEKLRGVELSGMAQQPVFVQLYDDQKSLEILRVKTINGNGNIEKMKKVTFNHVMTTITGPKKESPEIAIGYASGHVRLINSVTNQRSKSFNPDVMNNEVTSIDFNCTDEYLIVLYDNGNVRTFNVKTGIQSEKIKVDQSIGNVRYHSTKPHFIGMGFHNGAIQVWDSLKKRTIFKDSEAHGAPIRDVAWDVPNPDLLYTAGYDCAVKVFDIRKRFCTLNIKNEHPINCISVSSCGNFITTGNLSGQVHLYDTRKPITFVYETDISGGISSNKVHRLIPVPGSRDTNVKVDTPITSDVTQVGETLSPLSTSDALSDVDVDNLIAESRNIRKRDSITLSDSLVNMPNSRITGRRSSLMGAGGHRLSADFGAQNLMRYLDLSTESVSDATPSPTSTQNVTKRRSLQNISDFSNSIPEQQEPISTTPKTSFRSQMLKKVEEVDEKDIYATPPENIESVALSENKENIDFIPNGQTSTPNIPAPVLKQNNVTSQLIKDTPPTITSDSVTISNQDLSKLFSAIETLNTKFDQLNDRMDDFDLRLTQNQFYLQCISMNQEHYYNLLNDGVSTICEYLDFALPLPQAQPQLNLDPSRYNQNQ